MPPSPSSLLSSAKVPALLVTDPVNIRYITGISVSSGVILVTPRSYEFFVDARYTEVAAKVHKGVLKVRDRSELVSRLSSIPVCGFEARHVTVSVLARWKKSVKNTKFIQTEEAVEFFRRKKGSTEIRYLKKAESITKRLLKSVPTLLVPGITEREVAWILETKAREWGAERFSFEPIIAFASHTSRPHHRAGDRRLKKGDLVQVDIGVFYKGYSSDMSRVFATGPLTAKQKKALEAVERAKKEVIKAVHPGVLAKDLDALARKILGEYGMKKHFTHALGHGVGLEVHEGVTLAARDDRPLLKGEAIAIEPGVYFPGKFGVRTEDVVIVK